MQITMRDFPAEHTVYAPGCFDGSVGKTIPVRDDQGNVRDSGKLLAAEVADDGLSVALTVEVDDRAAEIVAEHDRFVERNGLRRYLRNDLS